VKLAGPEMPVTKRRKRHIQLRKTQVLIFVGAAKVVAIDNL
jgi:hypothetical protein